MMACDHAHHIRTSCLNARASSFKSITLNPKDMLTSLGNPKYEQMTEAIAHSKAIKMWGASSRQNELYVVWVEDLLCSVIQSTVSHRDCHTSVRLLMVVVARALTSWNLPSRVCSDPSVWIPPDDTLRTWLCMMALTSSGDASVLESKSQFSV